MPALGGILAFLGLLLLVYCLLDVATTREDQARTLPKPVWLLIVILLPFVGSLAWLLAGRPVGAARRSGRALPGRPAAGPTRPSNPDDDEAFLRELRRRAQEQRRAAQQDPETDPDAPG